MCVHPIDVVKVRMQVKLVEKPSLFSTLKSMIQKEGIFSLTKGLSGSMFRQMVYSSLIYALYPVIKSYMTKEDEFLSLEKKILASSISSFIGAAVGSPTDLVMIRMQAGNIQNYRNVFHGIYKCIRDEKLVGLLIGSKATIIL